MQLILADFSVTSAFTEIVSLLNTCWDFISGNPLLVIVVASPLVIGFIAALTSIFRRS